MAAGSSTIQQLLSRDGPVAQALADAGVPYELRPQQEQMCTSVALAMQQKSHLLVEAGTGVGKSFAYLLPAALRCVLHGEIVVVSTHTISLQEQLVAKDLPVIRRVLEILQERKQLPDAATPEGTPRELRPVLVKGRGNYVSVRRLKLASERQDKLFADPAAKRSLHVIEDWAYSTLDGTISTLPMLERAGVWDKVQSDSGNCMGKKCPTYERCFYQAARREMDAGNLLVCNHALFFSDLSLRSQDAGFLPAYDQVIFDEAHTVEEVAGEHFGVSLTEGRVQHLLTTLFQPRTGKGYLPQLSLVDGDTTGLDRAMRLVLQAQDTTKAFFEDLRALATRSKREGGEPARSWIQPGRASAGGGRAEPVVHRVREVHAVENALSGVMKELALRLRALRDQAKLDADRYELNAYAIRAELIAGDVGTLIEQALPASAYWIEVSGGDESFGRQRVTFAGAPIEVGPLLKERLFEQQCGVIMTSATLATGGTPQADGGANAAKESVGFAHVAKHLGCEGAAVLQLGSPFDYATQVRVYVEKPTLRRAPDEGVSDVPPDVFELGFATASDVMSRAGRRPDRQTPAWTLALSDAIARHVEATDGGAFVLFTSFATLRSVAAELAPAMARRAMPLLVQASGSDPWSPGVEGASGGAITGSRTAILQQFRADRRSVLLGAMSFWQGVDVRGEGLRNVIITKLPFDPPDRPLVQARGELIQARGGNPFMEDALPRAVLRFKQGFGRLIRSSTDRGRVVILDERVVTTRYGRLFLDALPQGVKIEVVRDDEE